MFCNISFQRSLPSVVLFSLHSIPLRFQFFVPACRFITVSYCGDSANLKWVSNFTKSCCSNLCGNFDWSEWESKETEWIPVQYCFFCNAPRFPPDSSIIYFAFDILVIVFQVALRGFLVILALSLHAIFEGMAVGLTQKARISAVRSLRPKLKNVWYFSWSFRFMIVRLWPILFPQASYVWYLFFAIAAHKFVISFCIGIQFVSSGLRPLFIVLYQVRNSTWE